MAAMLDNVKIAISYKKYSSAAPESLTVSPYALKEDMKRWYLIGFTDERKAMRVYGLDWEELVKRFVPAKAVDMNIAAYRAGYGME